MSAPLLSDTEFEHLAAQARQLVHQRQTRGAGHFAGPHITTQRGPGLELQDLRAYQYGDEVRHIAWRASARSPRPLVKVFHAERRLRRLLWLDQHPGMAFATRGELKAARALRAAALIGFSALQQQAEIGAIVSNTTDHFFPFSGKLNQWLRLLGIANRIPPSPWKGEGDLIKEAKQLQTQLHHLDRLATRNTELLLISDFQHWDDSLQTAIAPLADKCRVTALQIIDRGELELPAAGKLRLISPYDGQTHVIDSSNPQLRRRYREVMQQRQNNLSSLLKRSGIQHCVLYTDDDALTTINELL
ncbi:MAG: DUF58 domain-containing protein [Gammaproteobacteria bacterium]|nr:DUF58 domain-containing protein [Gammaproteobacteria bacterium]